MGDGWGENAYIPRQPYFREYPRLLVFENGVHFIDTYRYLAGEISRVTAWHRRLNPVIKGEDCALVVFEFANGALGEWDANRYNETTARQSPLHIRRISGRRNARQHPSGGGFTPDAEKTGRERSGASLRARGREFLRAIASISRKGISWTACWTGSHLRPAARNT